MPVVSASRIDTESLASADIDSAVRDALADGRPLYAVDAELLERLAPDLIVTQDLCEVCAVPSGEVRRVARIDVETVSLDPRDLGEIEESIRTLARHLGAAGPGEQLAQAMHHRIEGVRQAVRGLARPRVFVAEWLDPPFAAGHWVPEMVSLAGGEEVLGRARERSFETTWDAVARGRPATDRARALRLRRRAHGAARRAPCRRSALASSPSTATRPIRAPARASPRASRSSRTSCTPRPSRPRPCRRVS